MYITGNQVDFISRLRQLGCESGSGVFPKFIDEFNSYSGAMGVHWNNDVQREVNMIYNQLSGQKYYPNAQQ